MNLKQQGPLSDGEEDMLRMIKRRKIKEPTP
jgi:hypothetical protein